MVTELEDITKQLDGYAEKLDAIKARVEDAATPTDELAALKTAQEDLEGQIKPLLESKERAELLETVKAQGEQITALLQQRTAKKFEWPAQGGRGQGSDGAEQPHPSFCISLYRARLKGDQKAMKWWSEMEESARQREALYTADAWLDDAQAKALKALSEGTTTAGGYLVVPQYIQQLVALRRAFTPLRNFVTVIPVNSNLVYVPTQTAAETVAWTAENAPKSTSDETFSQISVNIFTLAGIAKVSNQLLEDSSPAVDAIVRASLGRGLAIEEDRAMINGSGSGQPTGIINTSGVTSTAASAQTAISILDDIAAAIGRFQAAYFGNPDAILMHPRTWTKLLTAKDTTNRYLGIGTVIGNQQMLLPGISNPTPDSGMPVTTLFGFPVILDANTPIALTVGMNTNRSVIVVGAFKEAWLLERGEDVRMDVSNVAGTSFEQNQTWFRGEERVGFTAARLTSAWQVVTDVGP